MNDDSVSTVAKITILEDQIAQLKVKNSVDSAGDLIAKAKELLNNKDIDGYEKVINEIHKHAKELKALSKELNGSSENEHERIQSATAVKYDDPNTTDEEKKKLLDEYGVYAHIETLIEECRHYATKIDGVDIDFHNQHSGDIREFCNKLRELCDDFSNKVVTW